MFVAIIIFTRFKWGFPIQMVVIFLSPASEIIAFATVELSTLIISAPSSVANLKLLIRCLCLSKAILAALSFGV